MSELTKWEPPGVQPARFVWPAIIFLVGLKPSSGVKS